MDLTHEPIFIDCQSSGASPKSSQLLELGWNERSWVMKPKESVAPKLLRLIGITSDELEQGQDANQVWKILCADIATRPNVFAVAHFARFEKTYLDRLWQEHAGTDFPLPMLCTQQLAKRLYPNLPSYGLRALAGWFGDPLPDGKRVDAHIAATKVIWKYTLAELMKRGIHSLEDALFFCQEKAPRRSGATSFLMPKEKRLGLPHQPGIYRYLDRLGQVIYVGKATSLKQRVNSYFTGGCRGDHRKLEMLAQAVDVEVVPVTTPLEAGLLEFQEIIQRNPRYNIAFKGRVRSPMEPLKILTPPATLVPEDGLLFGYACNEVFYGLKDPEVLTAGLLLWREENGLSLDEHLSPRKLLVLGLPLLKEWIAREKQRLAEREAQKNAALTAEDESGKDAEEESSVEDALEEVEEEFTWTPEFIAQECQSILRRAVRHHIRLKWWKRISEATLEYSWQSKNSKKATQKNPPAHIIWPQTVRFQEEDPRPVKLLLHELRRIESKDGSWRVVKPWPMHVPFWI